MSLMYNEGQVLGISSAPCLFHEETGDFLTFSGFTCNINDDGYASVGNPLGWSLQTFNTKECEYGSGKIGWMSERFCFCEGLVSE